MSHVVKLQVEIKNRQALIAACQRLGYQIGTEGTHTLYNSKEEGLSVNLPDWRFPVVIKADGSIAFDNYKGAWGDISVLNKLRQIYASEVTKFEFMLQGLSVYEEANQDGSLTLTVETGG